MTIAQIIAALLPIFAQAIPQLVADIANLIKGNPQAQGEADDAYVLRLTMLIDLNATKVATEDSSVES